jgi:flagellar basal-body rod protein FlgC
MLSTLNIAASALIAATRKVAAVAANLANSDSVGTLTESSAGSAPGGDAAGGGGQPAYQPVDVTNVGLADGGVAVRVWGRVPATTPSFEPGSPVADADGLVARPNVDAAQQLVTLAQAKQAYRANLAVMRTEDEMLGDLLDIRS